MAEILPISAESQARSIPITVFNAPQAQNGNDLHELRVRIPMDLHRQLLSLKVLRGRSLADTVSLALDIYFAHRERPEEDPGA